MRGTTYNTFDPALSKNERKVLKDWPEDALIALTKALSELGISESNRQAYLEGHLLSLPGWAGMIRWRSQQSIEEQELLIQYLAVRISMELAIVKPYLPLKNQKVEKKVEVVPPYSFLDLLGGYFNTGMVTNVCH